MFVVFLSPVKDQLESMYAHDNLCCISWMFSYKPANHSMLKLFFSMIKMKRSKNMKLINFLMRVVYDLFQVIYIETKKKSKPKPL